MHIIKICFFYISLISTSLAFIGCNLIGGAFEQKPQDLQTHISPEARALIDTAFEGINPSQLRDYHVHLLGMNTELNGTFVNEGWQSPFEGGIHYIQFEVYKSASGITDVTHADAQYLGRLKNLIQYMPHHGRFGLMAFDYFHNEEGQANAELSTFHVPNTYVMDTVQNNPEIFFPIISIHPYRKDAVQELTKYAKEGVRFVKWLPNAMGIHPASKTMNEQLETYYQVMSTHNMTLITHTGDEKATEAEEFQNLGNPIFLKKPLSMNVKVVMAHVASLGECRKEDMAICVPGQPYIDIAIDMLKDPQYTHLLFADISALTQDNRKDNLDKILANRSIHANLINGSDYPLPAVNIVIQTRTLESAGYITSKERESLNEIYDFNPLLFDFVLKRTLRHTKTGEKFPRTIFLEHPYLHTN